MTTYITTNGIKMLRCSPLNWEISSKYAIPSDDNSDVYLIYIGSISDMWQASLISETMILSFTSLHYSSDEVYRFKVESFEEASEMVLKFAKGMNIVEDLIGTIYWN